jgi:DNA-binding MarR family transcriptional regulator
MGARSPPADDSATWALFLTTHALLLREMERRLKTAGLPPLEWYDVLWALEQAPDQRLRMHALADQVVLTRFNLTRLIDRLEERGLVSREKTREDRRGSWAVLAADGRRLRRRMWPAYREAIVELFNRRLSASQHVALPAILQQLSAGLPPSAADIDPAT